MFGLQQIHVNESKQQKIRRIICAVRCFRGGEKCFWFSFVVDSVSVPVVTLCMWFTLTMLIHVAASHFHYCRNQNQQHSIFKSNSHLSVLIPVQWNRLFCTLKCFLSEEEETDLDRKRTRAFSITDVFLTYGWWRKVITWKDDPLKSIRS